VTVRSQYGHLNGLELNGEPAKDIFNAMKEVSRNAAKN
jgi:hypothetical protein